MKIEDLLLIVYSGQQRVGKTPLNLFVGSRWPSRRPDLVVRLVQLREDATDMISTLA